MVRTDDFCLQNFHLVAFRVAIIFFYKQQVNVLGTIFFVAGYSSSGSHNGSPHSKRLRKKKAKRKKRSSHKTVKPIKIVAPR